MIANHSRSSAYPQREIRISEYGIDPCLGAQSRQCQMSKQRYRMAVQSNPRTASDRAATVTTEAPCERSALPHRQGCSGCRFPMTSGAIGNEQ
jgi:hypothetical protein